MDYLYDHPLYLIQGAFMLWMLVDAFRRGEGYWPYVILFVPFFGAWGYFFVVMLPRWVGGRGWSLPALRRGPSLDELRFRAEQSPTLSNHINLAERLVERGEHAEAVPHLDEVLTRESEHCRALFLLATCHTHLDSREKAVACLEKIITRERYWSNYAAWYALIELREEMGDAAAAADASRELARLAPTLRHQCLLAERLLDADRPEEARQVLERALREYEYTSGGARWRNWRWASAARRLLREMERPA